MYYSISSLKRNYIAMPYQSFELYSIAELNRDIAPSPDLDTQLLLDRLFEIGDLGMGWDGERAQPASHVALRNAAFAIVELHNRPSPDIALLDSGGILFEWDLPDITCQIEWFSEGGGEYSAFSHEAVHIEGPMPEAASELGWKLRELTMTKYARAEFPAALSA